MLDASENVQNWFDMDKAAGKEPIIFEYPKGMLSIKEPIKVILNHADGENVLRKFIAPMFEHAMFKMIKGFSLEKIARMQPDALPESLLFAINQELILVKK
jgi:hypothetical protein